MRVSGKKIREKMTWMEGDGREKREDGRIAFLHLITPQVFRVLPHYGDQ